MPKKYQPSYNKSSSNYSVNDRLNQLRREQAPRSAIDRRNELAESLTARPVHPAVRQILNLPEVAAPRPRRSLVHYTCKTLAKNWESLLEYEQHYLGTLPVQLKDILLSYLAAYGPEDGITLETLRILFLTDHELDDATGSDELVHLDLTGMVSKQFTLGEITKYITQVPGPKKDALADAMNNLSVDTEVADSWEDAEEAELPVLPKSSLNPRIDG
ncbi:hypothetical protein UCDDS831_g05312 [Diplodia seriata]|uniref:Uncharacterized protein n=1 Tax=Diplodia seriata TaxID=420778 RepID=A0A0G2G7F3_9PEZI|nr:hypothetical protein UCDDS831_g05312 [Diplodia seriata]